MTTAFASLTSFNKRWVLPDHVADSLPAQASQIERARRAVLDTAHRYGYELVMPPLIEHLESLLTGAGEALALQTFQLVDQASGRTLGVRADATPQVARIDAHLLNRQGVTRLCYCGSALHAQPATPQASRELLQFGAEIYGHAGQEADLEVMQLALEVLRVMGVQDVLMSLSDVRIVSALIQSQDKAQAQVQAQAQLSPACEAQIVQALASKDGESLQAALDKEPHALDALTRQALLALPLLNGPARATLAEARARLPATPAIAEVLGALESLVQALGALMGSCADEALHIDLADVGGYGYYSATKFVMLSPSLQGCDPMARGGRYDEVGAAFGRARPAVGFGLDIKALMERLPLPPCKPSIRAPWPSWSCSGALRSVIAQLRQQGETVVCVLPGHEHEGEAFLCDRQIVQIKGQWVIQALA